MKKRTKHNLINWYIQLITAFRTADWPTFHALHFSQRAEGWWFDLHGCDFSNCFLIRLPGNFLRFINCSFRGSDLRGGEFVPVEFIDCDLRDANLKYCGGFFMFQNCDLRGVIFDKTTKILGTKSTELPSELINCKVDNDFRDYLLQEGVVFK